MHGATRDNYNFIEMLLVSSSPSLVPLHQLMLLRAERLSRLWQKPFPIPHRENFAPSFFFFFYLFPLPLALTAVIRATTQPSGVNYI